MVFDGRQVCFPFEEVSFWHPFEKGLPIEYGCPFCWAVPSEYILTYMSVAQFQKYACWTFLLSCGQCYERVAEGVAVSSYFTLVTYKLSSMDDSS